MASRISTPATDEACAFCGAAIFDHEPICVRDCTADCGSPTYFCNYACLRAHIDEAGLVEGTACTWSPE